MSNWQKTLIGAGVVVALGGLTFLAVRRDRGDRTEVRAEVVERRALVSRITATGHVEARRSVDISADISGRIVELPVGEGQRVEEDDLLLVIDPTQYRAALRRAEASLAEARARRARAKANFEQARRQYQRTKSLAERGENYVTEEEVDSAETQMNVRRAEWEAAKHAVEQAEAAVREAEDRLEKTVIRAPMSGRVTRLDVEKGETAVVGTMNNPGSLLLTISDLSEMEAVLEVDETDIPAVSVGDSASVQIDAFPQRSVAGRVRKIGHSSVAGRAGRGQAGGDEAVDFEVRVALRNPPSGIRPDLSATGDIITARRDSALAIPIISLTLRTPAGADGAQPPGGAEGEAGSPEDDDGREGVFLVSGDSVRFQPVEVGVAGDAYFEVRSGLSAGDTVVAGPYRAIREMEAGDRVEVTGWGAGAGEGSS